MKQLAESHRFQDEDPSSDLLDSLVGYNLKRAYMVLQSDFKATLGETGVTSRAFSVLSLIEKFPNITQSEISRQLGIERSGLVAIVDDLQARGYIVRVAVPGDRRVQALSLTKKGQTSFNSSKLAIVEHEKKLLNDFSEPEKEQLLRLLKRIRKIEVSST